MAAAPDTSASTTARAAAPGLVAATAMSGFRELTTNAGWLENAPPEAIVRR